MIRKLIAVVVFALVIALASYVMTHPVRLTVSSRWDQPLPQSGAAIAAVRTKLDWCGAPEKSFRFGRRSRG